MALADGILDAARAARAGDCCARKRALGRLDRAQKGKVTRGLDMLDREVPRFHRHVTIGQISVGCCLGWLDFRWGTADDWRIGRALLADWYSMFMTRPSMVATAPKDAG